MNQAAIEIEKATAGTEQTYQIITDDFRNDMFNTNIDFLKAEKPELYNSIKDYHCANYRLCINPDGSPNIIHMPGKSLVYYSEGNMILNSLREKLTHIPYKLIISPTYTLPDDKKDWFDKNPIISEMYNSLLQAGPIKKLDTENGLLDFNKAFRADFIPFLRVYGIGLGYHLTQLIQSKNILSLLIYEPEVDLFYTSLFTTPWHLIFKYMEMDPAKKLLLIVGQKPEQAIESEKNFLSGNFPFLQNTRWQFNHFNTENINQFIELENRHYTLQADGLRVGWYEDQKIGLVNFIDNLFKGTKVFTGKKSRKELRIAVVGAGPSLDESISYLGTHKDDFIIFACGTAITPLLKNNIIPDYHVHQERLSDQKDVISWADEDAYRNITALELNVVDAEIGSLYEDTLIFQKSNDPASALLPDDFPITKYVNPTVTNSAIAFASELGASEVYLFGVDYGAPKDGKKMHASHYVHAHRQSEKVDANSEYILPGNLGKTIVSTDKLLFSHEMAELAINSGKKTRWFNVGEGALIRGAKPREVNKLPEKLKSSLDKTVLKQEIKDCFSADYSMNQVIDNLENNHAVDIQHYFSGLREFLKAQPENRSEIISTLSLIHKAADAGWRNDHFMPHRLFSGGIKLYTDNVNIQNSMFNSDEAAVTFFNSAQQVFKQYIDDMHTDINAIILTAKKKLSASE